MDNFYSFLSNAAATAVFTIATVLAGQAHATAVEKTCVDDLKNKWKFYYDFVTGEAKAFQFQGYYYLPEGKSASVSARPDGTVIITTADETKINWAIVPGCYVKFPNLLEATINPDGRSGKLARVPNIIVRPGSNCKVPQPKLPPQLKMICQ